MGKVKSNLIFSVSYQILILIVPLITTPYISRVLLPSGVGMYSITTTITNYFYMFALLGMSTYGNRIIAKCNNSKEKISINFWNLYYFQAISAILITLLYIIYICIWGLEKYGNLIICQIPYMLTAVIEISWLFYGLEKFKFIVVRNIIIKILTTISIFIFVKTANDIWIYIIINSFSLFLGQLFLWTYVIKKIKIQKIDIKLVKSHLKPNLILFISVIAVSIYTLMDKIMIEKLASVEELGFYENSYKIMNICCSIIGAIGSVMLPRISMLIENNKKGEISEYIDKSVKYIMIFAIGITFGVIGVGIEFSELFFGIQFIKSGYILIAISPTILFFTWESILKTHFILPQNKDKIFVKGTILAAIANVISNFILIPKFGGVGAAIGTDIALGCSAIYQSIKIRKELNFKNYILTILPYLTVAILMSLICRFIAYFMQNSIKLLLLQIISGGLIYLIGALLISLKTKDEYICSFIKKIKEKFYGKKRTSI